MKKLVWHNNDCMTSRELFDPQLGSIVGGVLRNDNDGVWDIRIRDDNDDGVRYKTITNAKLQADAKRWLEKFFRQMDEYKDVIVIDEPKVRVEIYEDAFRQIIAHPELALDIAKAVLRDPSDWADLAQEKVGS